MSNSDEIETIKTALIAAREDLEIVASYLEPELEPVGPTIGKKIRLESISRSLELIEDGLLSVDALSQPTAQEGIPDDTRKQLSDMLVDYGRKRDLWNQGYDGTPMADAHSAILTFVSAIVGEAVLAVLKDREARG